MLNERFMKKLISVVSACAIYALTVGITIAPYVAQAAEENYFINEDYVTLTDDENIGGAIAYNDGLVLISNTSDKGYDSSYGYNNDSYTLTKDSELKFVDSDGLNHIISNKDSSGNQKYDAVYGTITNMFYSSIKVQKDGKYSLIDYYDNKIKLGPKNDYDYIGVVNSTESGVIYDLREYTDNSKKEFYLSLVNEDGASIFDMYSCVSVGITHNGNYFFILRNDGMGYIVKSNGELFYKGAANYISNIYDDKVVEIETNGYRIYYDLEKGEKIETDGKELKYNHDKTGKFGTYYILTDNEYIGYDNKLKAIMKIPGKYKKASMACNYQNLMLSDEKGLYNIYDKDGKAWFDEDVVMVSYYYENPSVIVSYNNGTYIVYDNGNKKVDFDIVSNIADNRIKEINKDILKASKNYHMVKDGVEFTYTLDDSQKYKVVVTLESNYNNAILKDEPDNTDYQLKDNEVLSGNIVYEKTDRNIVDVYGASRECKYRLSRIYSKNDGNVKVIIPQERLFAEKINGRYVKLYSEKGEIYGIQEDGEVIEKHESERFTYQFGDSGMKCTYYNVRVGSSVLAGGMETTNNDNNLIFKKEGYSVREPLTNLFSVGYINCSGRDVYTYDGNVAFQSSEYTHIYSHNNVAYALLKDGRLVKFRNILFSKLDNLLPADGSLKITEIDEENTRVLSGIETNKTVKNIKNIFNNTIVKMINSDGDELDDSKPVGTGCKIQMINNNQVVDTVTVMIKGDTDGTGTIDVLDMETIQKSILGIGDSLSGVYKEAALLNGDNTDEVTVLDMEAIQKDILGIEKINN